MQASPKNSLGQPRFDSAEQQVFLNLWRTYDCLKSVEDELFVRYRLSPQQYNALRLLSSIHPDSMPSQALGRRLISRAPDTTRMLDRLEKRSLVTRTRRQDNRRVVEIAITETGLALLGELADAVCEMHDRQLGHLSPREQRQLTDLLKRARKPHEDSTCDWLDA